MAINWKATQVAGAKNDKNKKIEPPKGVKPKYLSMGSFHADLHKDGKSRKVFKIKEKH